MPSTITISAQVSNLYAQIDSDKGALSPSFFISPPLTSINIAVRQRFIAAPKGSFTDETKEELLEKRLRKQSKYSAKVKGQAVESELCVVWEGKARATYILCILAIPPMGNTMIEFLGHLVKRNILISKIITLATGTKFLRKNISTLSQTLGKRTGYTNHPIDSTFLERLNTPPKESKRTDMPQDWKFPQILNHIIGLPLNVNLRQPLSKRMGARWLAGDAVATQVSVVIHLSTAQTIYPSAPYTASSDPASSSSTSPSLLYTEDSSLSISSSPASTLLDRTPSLESNEASSRDSVTPITPRLRGFWADPRAQGLLRRQERRPVPYAHYRVTIGTHQASDGTYRQHVMQVNIEDVQEAAMTLLALSEEPRDEVMTAIEALLVLSRDDMNVEMGC